MDSTMMGIRPIELSAWPDPKDSQGTTALNPAWLWERGYVVSRAMAEEPRCGEEAALGDLAILQGLDSLHPSLNDQFQAVSHQTVSDRFSPTGDQVFVLDITASCTPDAQHDVINLDPPPQLVSSTRSESVCSSPATSVAPSGAYPVSDRIPISMLLPFPGQGTSNQKAQTQLPNPGVNVVSQEVSSLLAQRQPSPHSNGSASPFQQQTSPYQDAAQACSPYSNLSPEPPVYQPSSGTPSPFPGSQYKSDPEPITNTLGPDVGVPLSVRQANPLPPLSQAPMTGLLDQHNELPVFSQAQMAAILESHSNSLPIISQPPMTLGLEPQNIVLPPLSQAPLYQQNIATQNNVVTSVPSTPPMYSALTMKTFTGISSLDTVPREAQVNPQAVIPAVETNRWASSSIKETGSDKANTATSNVQPAAAISSAKRQKTSPVGRPTPRVKRAACQTRGRGVKKNASYLPPCKVCEAPGTGYHYGVTTCEACKGFFRRCLTRKHEPICHNEGAGAGGCDISYGVPNACPYCRYQKCTEVGMSVKAIRLGRYTLTKKTQDIIEVKHLEAKQHQQSQAHARGLETEAFVAEVLASHREIMDYWQNTPGLENMEQLKQQHALSRISPGGANCPSTHLSTEDFIALYRKTGIKMDDRIKNMSIWGEFFESGLSRLVSFMKRIPGFKALGPTDQLHLIKCSYIETVMLGRQNLFDVESRLYIGADGDRIHPFPLDLTVGHQVASSLLKVAQKLQKLQPSYEETCLLKLLNIYSTERHNFESPESVGTTHAKCLDALYYVMERNTSAGTTCSPNLRFAKMAEVMTQLRSLNHELSHYFKKTVLTFTESQLLTLPPLFNEIVKSI